MKKIFSTAVLSTLMALPAFAQENIPTQMKNDPPATQDSRRQGSGDQVTSGQISASKLLDETVMNEANESVGDVNDVILDSNGKVASVIVGVGGTD